MEQNVCVQLIRNSSPIVETKSFLCLLPLTFVKIWQAYSLAVIPLRFIFAVSFCTHFYVWGTLFLSYFLVKMYAISFLMLLGLINLVVNEEYLLRMQLLW